ncbi:hypothetical protein POM88_042199 [Heracleum sosnowskyi]|uniref:HAT C-terminal dimerisation domain-containing protein n=1 Tax=Heracleum sosnowskyi TaxID=360622 RepID=A0AAD8HHB8_9APIA|nr:hypothetical protein POM88_042199 [Heracleum sosnowskyi]
MLDRAILYRRAFVELSRAENAIVEVANVMFKLKKLFVEYMPKGRNNSTEASSCTSNPKISKRPKFNLADLDTEDSSDVSTKSKLDLYLEEPRLNRDEELNILDFWGKNETKYGELSYMARDILSVPLTTVASESSFSIGGRILNKWRSSYLPENVEFKKWMTKNALVVKWNGLQRDEFGGLATSRLDKVMEGGAVVLTLKDQSILANGDINEDVDILENVEIGEQKQRDDAYKAAKRKPGTYEDN